MTEDEKLYRVAKIAQETAEELAHWKSKYHEAIAAQEQEKAEAERARQSGDAMAVLKALRTAA
jgi:hypothetical protein